MTSSILDLALANLITLIPITGAVIWFLKNWMKTRIKVSIEHESKKEIEELKSKLSKETENNLEVFRSEVAKARDAFNFISDSFTLGQKAANEKRLDAIQHIWNSIIEFKGFIDPKIGTIDYVTPDEMKTYCKREDFKKLINTIFETDNYEIYHDRKIENYRLFISDYLWGLFYFQRAIKYRIAYVIECMQKEKKSGNWTEDSGLLDLLRGIFPENEVKEFKNIKFGHLNWLNKNIESKFLRESRDFIAGKVTTNEALEAIKKMKNHIEEAELQENKN